MASNGEVITGAHSCPRPQAAWKGARILPSSVSSSPVMRSFGGSGGPRLHTDTRGKSRLWARVRAWVRTPGERRWVVVTGLLLTLSEECAL